MRIEQRGLVFRQLSFGLGQGRLVGARVDFHQQVALMHGLPFFEGTFTIWPSTRVLTVTVLNAVTVPMAVR